MSFWKILAGAAVGVGAVAAAPFTGGGSIVGAVTLASSLAGAGTVAAAVGAGAAGAAIASNIGDDVDSIKEEGRQEGKAEHQKEIEALYGKLNESLSKLDSAAQHYDAIYAMEAVAVAVAYCDGEICEKEREDIQQFINGTSGSALPDSVKRTVEDIYKNPPNIKESFKMANESGVDMDVFEDIINIVMHADGKVHQHEHAFIQAWNELKSAA